jgi:hypothetical protein
LSPAVIHGHLPLPFPQVPSNLLVRGFIAFTCVFVIALLSSWRFVSKGLPSGYRTVKYTLEN